MTPPSPHEQAIEKILEKVLSDVGDAFDLYEHSDEHGLELYDEHRGVYMSEAKSTLLDLLAKAEREAVRKFISDKTIVEKFETLAGYIPELGQYGYLDGMREEVDDFINQLKNDSKQIEEEV